MCVFCMSLWHTEKSKNTLRCRWQMATTTVQREETDKEMEKQRTNLITQVKENIKTPSNICCHHHSGTGWGKESVQETGIILCDNYWSYRITMANLKTNLGIHILKGTVHPNMDIYWKMTLRPLLLQNWCGETEHCIKCSQMDPLQWMGAITMRVQTADKNITIIHK